MRRVVGLIVKFACVVIAVGTGLGWADSVMADNAPWIGTGSGGASSSGGATGASCNESRSNYLYREDCAGVSWIYYAAVTPTNDSVTFAPFTKLGNSGRNMQIDIPAVCSNNGNGGFWHYGVNVQATSGDYFMDFSSWYKHDLYSTSQYSWGHWTTVNDQLASWAPYSEPGQAGYSTGKWSSYNWNVGSLHHDLGRNGVVYYTADHTSSGGKSGEVLDAYKEAAAAAGRSGETYIPNDVYAFCYWPGMGDPSSNYYSRSTVKAGINSADTDITSSDKRVDVSVTVSTGELVPVEFTHRLYASTETNGVSWSVKKTTKVISGSSVYSHEVKAGSKTDESGTVNLNNNIGSYYTGNRVEDGTGNWYLARDSYELKFDNEGEYEFCEVLTGSKDGNNFPTTTACAKIKVQKVNTSYYARSNVAVRVAGRATSDYSTTEIVASGEAEAVETDVPVGQNVDLVFSHTIYSSKAINGVDWSINRGTLTGNDYQIVSQPMCGNSGKANFTTKDGNSYGYYVGDPRNCSDGTNPFIARDVFTIRFTSENGYVERCETISVDNVQKTRVCAKASAKKSPTSCSAWTPSSYTSSNASSGTTSVVSKVRNTSLTNSYADWQNAVYAKPTDKIGWINCYYPGVQFAANTTVTHENQHPEPTEGLWYSNTLNNHIFSAYSDWTNRYSIGSHNLTPSFSAYETFAAGMTDIKDTQNEYNVRTGQASQTLWETITSGYPTSVSASDGAGPHEWACHYRCDSDTCGTHCCASHEECEETCTGEGESKSCSESCTTVCDAECCNWCYVDTCSHTNLYYANSRSGTASDTSYVYVPYNFTNSAAVNISSSVLYAGETATIASSTVTVHTRYNSETQGDYATQVDDAQTKLVGYLSSSSTGTAKAGYGSSNICAALPYKDNSCDELNYYSGLTFNSSANMRGSTDSLGFSGQTYNVYDAKAGDYYCVVVAVYPYTSGSDTNLNSSGSNNWYISAPSCKVIAKRPSFQVWGGSVYSEKSIKTSSAAKNNIRSVYSYTTTGKRNTTIYGSWVEQAVLANGFVSGLGSGAAMGDLTKAPWSGSKEGASPNYCTYRVPLSIANYSSTASQLICPSYQQVGSAELANAAVDRNALMSYWWVLSADAYSASTIDLASDYIETRSLQGNQIRYTQSSGNITLVAATIPKGATHLVEANGDVRINGNIAYQSANYTTAGEIPKLLIYSTGDITIDCGVDRVDAIIVAEGRVSSCDSTDVNAAANSRQLTINGMIIADSLVLNRTYGAATSVNSSVPAEIINYDTSAIIWGKGMADANDFETLTTVYQHELAPRY